MKPEVKQLWCEALRSGKYKQGIGRLNRNNEMCCLGVLCDIHRRAIGGRWVPDPDPDEGRICFGYLGQDDAPNAVTYADLPVSVMEWAGLKQSAPRLGEGIDACYANDVKRLGFHEIADLIEKHL